MSVTWEQTPFKGDAPLARSGHTMCTIGTKCYMFGGVGSRGENP
eukprot:CAMPEP_0170152732 /NCGR_PEP_ID=MMETSP0033_2-20121228/53354_1 /TAXON_ID=195969 /ORGANISM="Dolichomastix tenuilepis, Strain CCMP3274" /LENGTH=43 /DNA_ID= /DNA_START= /DNA_END= /DNA_ORIENTATION=